MRPRGQLRIAPAHANSACDARRVVAAKGTGRDRLEFYSVHCERSALRTVTVTYARCLDAACDIRRGSVALTLAIVVTGCATAPIGGPPLPAQPAAPVPRSVEPPPPTINLSGFPLPYRQGYADGCASTSGSERKDAARFAADPNYRTGWQDGLALCRKK